MSVYDGCVVCWRGEKMGMWQKEFIRRAAQYDFPIFEPYYALNQKQKDMLWHGLPYDRKKDIHEQVSIDAFFQMVKENQYKNTIPGDAEPFPWQDGLSRLPWHTTQEGSHPCEDRRKKHYRTGGNVDYQSGRLGSTSWSLQNTSRASAKDCLPKSTTACSSCSM